MSAEARPQLGLGQADVEAVAHRMEEQIADVTPTRWGWTTPGSSVRFASGRQVVIQRRPAAETARMAAAIVAFAAAGVPVPSILLRVPSGPDELIAFVHVPGEVAAARLEGPTGAILAGRMGAALEMVRSVPAAGIPLDPAWEGPAALGSAIAEWLARADLGPRLSAIATAASEMVCAQPWAPVTTHGDYVPVNMLFAGDVLSAILDLGDVALRHPLIDPAWWSLIVGHHHPSAGPARAAFLASRGIPATDRELAAVAIVRGTQLAAGAQSAQRPGARALIEAAASAWAASSPGSSQQPIG